MSIAFSPFITCPAVAQTRHCGAQSRRNLRTPGLAVDAPRVLATPVVLTNQPEPRKFIPRNHRQWRCQRQASRRFPYEIFVSATSSACELQSQAHAHTHARSGPSNSNQPTSATLDWKAACPDHSALKPPAPEGQAPTTTFTINFTAVKLCRRSSRETRFETHPSPGSKRTGSSLRSASAPVVPARPGGSARLERIQSEQQKAASDLLNKVTSLNVTYRSHGGGGQGSSRSRRPTRS